jgi:hypothetical protein
MWFFLTDKSLKIGFLTRFGPSSALPPRKISPFGWLSKRKRGKQSRLVVGKFGNLTFL